MLSVWNGGHVAAPGVTQEHHFRRPPFSTLLWGTRSIHSSVPLTTYKNEQQQKRKLLYLRAGGQPWLFVCWCAAMLELLIVARLKVPPVMQPVSLCIYTCLYDQTPAKVHREAVWKVSF